MLPVTQLLTMIESGVPTAAERLLPLVYNELRALAAARRSCAVAPQTALKSLRISRNQLDSIPHILESQETIEPPREQ